MRHPGPMNTDGGIHEIPLPSSASGRLWLCGKHAIGPDPEGVLQRMGADGVVCLNEEQELADRYPEYITWLRAQSVERALWYPIPDLHAPAFEQFAPVLTDIVDRVVAGSRLIVHCGAGIGRAGTRQWRCWCRWRFRSTRRSSTCAATAQRRGPKLAPSSSWFVDCTRT